MLIGFLKTGKDGNVCVLSALNGEGRSIIKPGQYLYKCCKRLDSGGTEIFRQRKELLF